MILKTRSAVLVFSLVILGGASFVCAAHHSGQSGQNHPSNQSNQPKPPQQPQTPAQPPASQPSLSPDKMAEAAALATLTKAKEAQKAVTDAAWGKFQQTQDWTDAQTNLTAAQNDVESAKQAAVDNVKNNPDYQAAQAEKDKAVAALKDAQSSGDASPETLAPLANASMQASAKLRKIQTDLTANDTTIQAATDKLATVQNQSELLKMKFQKDLSADKQYIVAKKAVDDAESKYNDAHAKVASEPGS